MLSSYYDVLQDLYPEPGYGLAVAPDPAFHLTHRGVSIEVFGVIARFMAANRDLTYRMARGWRRSRPGRQTRNPDPAIPVDGGRPQVRAPLIRHGPALGAMLSMTGMRRPPTWPPPA
ncbi:MAG: hypothetical protein MIN69_10175 [Methylorubrum extorquens]|uniref:hypothetical protein n=1 Tax=Methylorubrum extorquens TaxID=408 RepID=UPI002FEE49C5